MSKNLALSEGVVPVNPQEVDLEYNKWGEIEPYGWKIGIKGEEQQFKKEYGDRKKRRIEATERNQRARGRDIKRIIHDHEQNEKYRAMYDTYMRAQRVRENMGQEFARILDEDCDVPSDFRDPDTLPWKTSAMMQSEVDVQRSHK
jgi:hypothetical protein